MNDLRDYLTAPARELALPVDHLSASSAGMFDRCPEQYRRRYVLGQKEKPGAALILGGAFHFAQEHNFTQKIQTGADLPISEVKEAFHHGFDRKIEESGGAEEISWDEREKADSVRKKGEILAVQYREQVSPSLQPAAVEEKFELALEGVPVPIIGYIDFDGHYLVHPAADLDRPDEAVPLDVDYKTANRKQSTIKSSWRLQARTYQIAKRKRIEFHVAVKGSSPVVLTPTTEGALAMEYSDVAAKIYAQKYQRIAAQIAWCWATYGADQPWPDATAADWACDWCGYRPTCPHWLHERWEVA